MTMQNIGRGQGNESVKIHMPFIIPLISLL